MYEEEQAQLREGPAAGPWGHFNLAERVRQAQECADTGNAYRLAGFPSCVLVLIKGADEVVTRRLRRLRHQVDQGNKDFALGNQPPYVVERVMATELPEGWTP